LSTIRTLCVAYQVLFCCDHITVRSTDHENCAVLCVTHCPLGPNILLSNLITKALGSYFNTRRQVSQPYSTTGKDVSTVVFP
jgi:hypothetical protein